MPTTSGSVKLKREASLMNDMSSIFLTNRCKQVTSVQGNTRCRVGLGTEASSFWKDLRQTYLSLSGLLLCFSMTGILVKFLSFSLTKQWLFSIVCRLDLTIRPTSTPVESFSPLALSVLIRRERPQEVLSGKGRAGGP